MSPDRPLLEFDLGEADQGYFDTGDLAESTGNLYLYVDGVEFGSLFFHADDAPLEISLGQYDHQQEDWVERSRLVRSVNYTEENSP
jgi:hypothetical protein